MTMIKNRPGWTTSPSRRTYNPTEVGDHGGYVSEYFEHGGCRWLMLSHLTAQSYYAGLELALACRAYGREWLFDWSDDEHDLLEGLRWGFCSTELVWKDEVNDAEDR